MSHTIRTLFLLMGISLISKMMPIAYGASTSAAASLEDAEHKGTLNSSLTSTSLVAHGGSLDSYSSEPLTISSLNSVFEAIAARSLGECYAARAEINKLNNDIAGKQSALDILQSQFKRTYQTDGSARLIGSVPTDQRGTCLDQQCIMNKAAMFLETAQTRQKFLEIKQAESNKIHNFYSGAAKNIQVIKNIADTIIPWHLFMPSNLPAQMAAQMPYMHQQPMYQQRFVDESLVSYTTGFEKLTSTLFFDFVNIDTRLPQSSQKEAIKSILRGAICSEDLGDTQRTLNDWFKNFPIFYDGANAAVQQASLRLHLINADYDSAASEENEVEQAKKLSDYHRKNQVALQAYRNAQQELGVLRAVKDWLKETVMKPLTRLSRLS
ncbi:MAG: hypothetical protein NTX76_04835 [Alphaproteobacteria bacterium]|nr:hypothetical protein [Alphaproteobacteria bacterium]